MTLTLSLQDTVDETILREDVRIDLNEVRFRPLLAVIYEAYFNLEVKMIDAKKKIKSNYN